MRKPELETVDGRSESKNKEVRMSQAEIKAIQHGAKRY